ncbi:MAG TPA: hypothetical protein VMT20_13910 [Terriglobia bacterium]|nr:hypothetical protein [Terriglobia bacterium]
MRRKTGGRAHRLNTVKLAVIACLIELQVVAAFAWVYPEHRDIAVLAVERLDPEQRALLQKLWAEARLGHEAQFCGPMADPAQGTNPTCIDLAAWTAIAGDHSCSASDMLNNVLNTPWIIGVARVSARLKAQLAAAQRRDQRVNAVRSSDIALQRADPDYVTRASSNNAHFLLPRTTVTMTPEGYVRLALSPKADLNALATYVWFHLRALAMASEVARGGLAPEAHAKAVRAALADETFALHFLQDSFAAGHAIGTWGNTAIRKGTHDYYNEHGVSLTTWSGQPFVALGDAYMRPQDADRAAAAVRDSLAQLLDTFAGKTTLNLDNLAETGPDGFDVCQKEHFPETAGTVAEIRALVPILEQTPVPTLGAGLGELPRFRAELGPFIGVTAAARGGALSGGFAANQTGASGTAGLETAVRLGLGLEGALNESSDGLAFAEFGLRQDAHSSGTAEVPGRGGITARFRAPFWLIPGDLLVAAPILAFTSRRTLQKMAVEAAGGGLIPWQAGIATRIGRFQFVLGREVGLAFFNHGQNHPMTIPTPGVPPVNTTIVAVNSMQVEFPIFEYRPFRYFSLDQSSSLTIQPYVGFDKPSSPSVVSPTGAPAPHLRTVTTAGVRVVFDWRHYLK